MQHYKMEIAILGGGCIGSSLFYALGQQVDEIALIDDKAPTSATQQSLGLCRVFHENIKHTQLALKHYQLAQTLTFALALRQSGSLYLFHRKRLPNYQASLKLLEKTAYPFELLTAEAARARFPNFHVKPNECVLFEPFGAKVNPSTFTQQLQTHSRGTTFWGHIKAIVCLPQHFLLEAENFTLECRYLILAGGFRLLPQLHSLGIQLPLASKKILTYRTQLQQSLALPHYFDRETLEFATQDEKGGVILGSPQSRRLPYLRQRQMEKNIAYDCYAPNRLGYLGALTHLPRLYLATGWGGTGLKFSLSIGQLLAHALTKTRKCYATT